LGSFSRRQFGHFALARGLWLYATTPNYVFFHLWRDCIPNTN
jgi:hypothetical protein